MSFSSPVHSPLYQPHSASASSSTAFNEDSPPGLTASGSSDDGSSPSSVAGEQVPSSASSFSPKVAGSSRPSASGSAYQAMSPWTSTSDDSFATSRRGAGDDDMEFASFGSANDHGLSHSGGYLASPALSHSHDFSMSASPSMSSPVFATPSDDEARELRAASQRVASLNGRFASTPLKPYTNGLPWADTPLNDEQMFDSIIEENSFVPPPSRTSEYSTSPQSRSSHLSSAFGAMNIPNSLASVSSSTVPINIKAEQQSDGYPTPASVLAATTPILSPRATASASASATASRRGSMDAAKAARMIGAARGDGQGGSASSDGEVALSATTVARPDADTLSDLQIHVHGIPARGAKSRVETQIKAHLELVRPISSGKVSAEDVAGWERIGSYSHLKLPPLSATKRKTKKNQQSIGDIPKEKTLYLDVAVVNASPPHQRAFACTGCSEREKKRADRRKNCKAKSGPLPTEEEMRKLDIDPQDPNAAELAAERLIHEEAKRIILFNCGDYIEFKDGHAELPTRVTCYCRHHKEKLGFCILFTMRNWKGKTVACGSTPAIMITDDHKSSAAMERFRRDAAFASGPLPLNGKTPESVEQQRRSRSATSFDRSRANSFDGNESISGSGANRNKVRKGRAKPYDPPKRSASGVGGFGMTPLGSNGALSLDMRDDSRSSETQSDFVQMLAAIGDERAELANSVSIHQEQANGDSFASPVPQQQLQDYNALLAGGSISPETLTTNPLSLPNFDFTHPAIAQQMLALLIQQGFMPQFGGHLSNPSVPGWSQQPIVSQPLEPPQPLPTISKIIPGEGPTIGGIEVTVLGDNFVDGMTCFFGDLAASSTRVWAANTLICVLPPSPSPGPVAVTLKTAEEVNTGHLCPRPQGTLQLFTYVDKSDTQLMELALQVVGFQQTKTMQVPRDIALRLLASGGGGSTSSEGGQQHGRGTKQHQMSTTNGRDAIAGVFSAAAAATCSSQSAQSEGAPSSSFQDTIINFLSLLEADIGLPRRVDAIRLANSSGHTLLHLAVILGFHRLASKLLDLGCPVDARDCGGYTALHLAALTGRTTVARILLNHGARSVRTSFSGQTPFDFTLSQDYPDIERMLRDSAIQQSGNVRGYAGVGGYEGDDDSISSYPDEEEGEGVSDADDDWSSSEEKEEEESEEETVEEDLISSMESTPRALPSPPAIDVGLLKVDKQDLTQLNDKGKSEKRGPLASNQALRILANKLPGGVSFLDVTDRLLPHSLQQRMQAVTVFHMTMPAPASLRNWVGSSPSRSTEGDKDQQVSGDAIGHAEEQEDTSRLTTLWRHILDETNTWMSSSMQIAPPPAYETATAGRGEKATGSVEPQTVKAHDASPHSAEGIEPSSSSSSGTAGPSFTPLKRFTSERRASRRPSPASTPKQSSTASSSATPMSSTMAVEDDWMLKWFWLPCLIFALLLTMFSTGPLSVESLLGYVPNLGGGAGGVATATAATAAGFGGMAGRAGGGGARGRG